jgi:hypothetical protein
MIAQDKQQFLDPITTISRITLLHFCPHGTKISICGNTIKINDYVQWPIYNSLMRKVYSDSRNDICYLYPTFVRFIELYLLEKQKNNETCYKYLKKLAEFAIKGLIELQKTYGYDNVSFTIQFYITLLKDSIESRYSVSSLPEPLKELTKHNLLDDHKVQKIWDDGHIIELSKTFEQCFVAEENGDHLLLNANKRKILDILEAHDQEFRKILGTDKSNAV